MTDELLKTIVECFCVVVGSAGCFVATIALLKDKQDEIERLKQEAEKLTKERKGKMTDKKFTDKKDKKIIQRLEWCVKCDIPNYDSDFVLDLINRQKAEIEQWQEEANKWQIFFSQEIDNRGKIKAEAYKEFAEKIKSIVLPAISKEIRNNFTQDLVENAYLNMCSMEEMKIAIEALEKQIPKKPTKTAREIVCPTCRTLVGSSPYCRYCGQALDWSDTE